MSEIKQVVGYLTIPTYKKCRQPLVIRMFQAGDLPDHVMHAYLSYKMYSNHRSFPLLRHSLGDVSTKNSNTTSKMLKFVSVVAFACLGFVLADNVVFKDCGRCLFTCLRVYF